jgi:glutathione S-transferase
VKLYTDPLAPNPRRVHWLMAEKGIEDIEIVPVSLIEQAHRAPAFLDMAGVPAVPQLELDDGTVIGESLAICRYLESLHPEPNLFGRDPLETALIETWTRRAELLFALPLMLSVRLSHPALACMEPDQSPERAAAQAAAVQRAMPVLERRLAASEWLGGERFTIADIVAGASLSFSRIVRFELDPAFPSVRRWAEAALARPGAKPKRP